MDPPSLTGLSHFQLHVSDMDASAAWYTQVLGLEEFQRKAGRYVGLRSASGHFSLALSPGGRPDDRGALDHIAFGVPDLDTLEVWADHLASVGIAHEGIKPNPVGHSVDLFDPDGNNIELVSEA